MALTSIVDHGEARPDWDWLKGAKVSVRARKKAKNIASRPGLIALARMTRNELTARLAADYARWATDAQYREVRSRQLAEGSPPGVSSPEAGT